MTDVLIAMQKQGQMFYPAHPQRSVNMFENVGSGTSLHAGCMNLCNYKHHDPSVRSIVDVPHIATAATQGKATASTSPLMPELEWDMAVKAIAEHSQDPRKAFVVFCNFLASMMSQDLINMARRREAFRLHCGNISQRIEKMSHTIDRLSNQLTVSIQLSYIQPRRPTNSASSCDGSSSSRSSIMTDSSFSKGSADGNSLRPCLQNLESTSDYGYERKVMNWLVKNQPQSPSPIGDQFAKPSVASTYPSVILPMASSNASDSDYGYHGHRPKVMIGNALFQAALRQLPGNRATKQCQLL